MALHCPKNYWRPHDKALIMKEHLRIISDPDKSHCDLHIVCQDGELFYTKILFYFFHPSCKTLFESEDLGKHDQRMVLIDQAHSLKDILSFYEYSENLVSTEEEEASSYQGHSIDVEEVSVKVDYLAQDSSGLTSKVIDFECSSDKETNNSKKDTTVFCECCAMKFESTKKLKAHIWSKHKSKPEITFKCQDCPKEFPHKYQLKKHLIVHMSPSFVCSSCEKVFKRKNELLVHYKTYHDHEVEKVLHTCSTCSMAFSKKSNLIRHLSKHEQDKFKCLTCSATFNRLDSYKRHQKIHL